MKFKKDRQFFCVSNHLLWFVLFSFIFEINLAQDTTVLKEIDINTAKISLSQIGKKTESIDSFYSHQFKFNSIADLINFNSSVFIKNYGPGAISSTAFRGGNASQTAILWNGFNIQNPMLGQTDLSLIPSVLFDQIEIEYGGSSSLFGSGAVGGSIHLNNKTLFNQGLFSSTNIGSGNFGLINVSSSLLLSKKRFISSTKFYLNACDNNFMFKDNNDKENTIKEQVNGNYFFKGIMQELKFLINSKQFLELNTWINSNQRHLASYNNFSDTKIYQQDNAFRLAANWCFVNLNFKSSIKIGLFSDQINYTDSMALLFSKNNSITKSIENENYFTYRKHHQLNFGISFNSNTAYTNNYLSDKSLNRSSFLIGNKFSFFKQKLILYTSLRIDYFNIGTSPITGNSAIEYKFKDFVIKTNIAKVYRQPTLNELYWFPGGNLNLKPEQGFSLESSVNYYKTINGKTSILISGAAFSRRIENWILWLPGPNQNATPKNIQQVFSRGLESTFKINHQKNNFKFGIAVLSSYVLSEIESNYQENNASINKQLIYTPRYQTNFNCYIGYFKANIILFHQYVGYRFTTSDNSEWLNPYQVSTLKFNYNTFIKKSNLILFMACNNLMNTSYTIVSGRPMPLRNYEFGITIQLKNN